MQIINVIPLEKGVFIGKLSYFSKDQINKGDIVVVPWRNKKILGLVISSVDATELKSAVKQEDFSLKKIVSVKKENIFLKEFSGGLIDIADYFIAQKNNLSYLIPSIFVKEYDKIANIKREIKDETKDRIRDLENFKNIKSAKLESLLLQAPIEDRITYYKSTIRESFAKKESVFITLPTLEDIKIFKEMLCVGIENLTFAFHGNLNNKKILAELEKAVNSDHPVLLLGTVPFLSIPRKDLGKIIIERESSNAYKTIHKPEIDLRKFAELFAMKIKAQLILADTLLSFESLARKEIDNFNEIIPILFRTNLKGEIKIIGRNKEEENEEKGVKKEKFSILPEETVDNIKDFVDSKKSVFIFSLRKGLATMTICNDCQEVVSCEKCLAPLVLYLSRKGKERTFVCNRCQIEKGSEILCEYCKSWNLVPLGIGTDTVLEEIENTFLKSYKKNKAGMKNSASQKHKNNKVKIFKIDKETVKSTRATEEIIKSFQGNPGSILIGTSAVFPYLREKIPLSVIASFDSLWSIPDFRMPEKILQIITSLIEKTNKIIIQTKNSKDPILQSVISGNLSHFFGEELEIRKKFNYPPFSRFIKITYIGRKVAAQKVRSDLEEIFKEYNPEIFSSFVNKSGRYAVNALLKIDNKNWSLPEFSSNSRIDKTLLEKLQNLPQDFTVTIDPEKLY